MFPEVAPNMSDFIVLFHVTLPNLYNPDVDGGYLPGV